MTINLCLNGFSIRQTTATQRAVKVYEGAKLTITDANGGCVIGGTSFAGGQGGVIQSFIGLLVLQLLDNVMSTIGVDAYWQKLLTGVIIVLIIASDCFGRKLKRERV